MTLARIVIILAFGYSSVGIASGQESSPINIHESSVRTAGDRYDQRSRQIFATLTTRAELFEAKARFATQCAKGLQLIQKVAALTAPKDDEEEAQWTRETFFLVRMWFGKEDQDEWYFAGQEVAENGKALMEEAHSKEEVLERYKKVFALVMNAQIAVLEKMSRDLDARMNRIKEPQSSD